MGFSETQQSSEVNVYKACSIFKTPGLIKLWCLCSIHVLRYFILLCKTECILDSSNKKSEITKETSDCFRETKTSVTVFHVALYLLPLGTASHFLYQK